MNLRIGNSAMIFKERFRNDSTRAFHGLKTPLALEGPIVIAGEKFKSIVLFISLLRVRHSPR